MNSHAKEAADGDSHEALQRVRQLRSAKFLLEVVAPAVAALPAEGTLSSGQLDQLLIEFKSKNPGPDDDFDMGMVQSRALFVQTYTEKDIRQIWPWHKDPAQLLKIMQRTATIVLNYEPTDV